MRRDVTSFQIEILHTIRGRTFAERRDFCTAMLEEVSTSHRVRCWLTGFYLLSARSEESPDIPSELELFVQDMEESIRRNDQQKTGRCLVLKGELRDGKIAMEGDRETILAALKAIPGLHSKSLITIHSKLGIPMLSIARPDPRGDKRHCCIIS